MNTLIWHENKTQTKKITENSCNLKGAVLLPESLQRIKEFLLLPDARDVVARQRAPRISTVASLHFI